MADKETQTITAADVGTVPAALFGKPVVRGTGTFSPPDPDASPADAASQVSLARADLLQRHKALTQQIAGLRAEQNEIEKKLAAIDARDSLAAKLRGMTPAELALLHETLAEKAQKQIDAAAGA